MDAAVKIIKVQDVGGINPNTLAPDPHTQVTYMVGEHGPFTLVTPSKHFTEDYVSTETQKRVDALRAIGAIT
jgi:hypothetical protein